MTDLKCMYCAENGITNTDVFIEIVDVELGAGWICKECFIESEKEKDEHLKDLEQQLKRKEQECEELKAKCKKYGEINEQETKDYAELKAENDKLKTALTEIKEIVFPKNQLIITDSPIILKLQQKISEVEE